MTKDQILQLTGLSEDQFYDQYPDQESFCADYPDACAALTEASKGGAVKPMSPSQTVRSVASNNQPVFTGIVANPMEYMYKHGGGIHINPANKGKFTASANRAGMGVQEFASHVLANKEDYSATQVKRANFARNASKWKHEDGGELEQYQKGSQVNAPIYTTDKNKVKNYTDSLALFNSNKYDIETGKRKNYGENSRDESIRDYISFNDAPDNISKGISTNYSPYFEISPYSWYILDNVNYNVNKKGDVITSKNKYLPEAGYDYYIYNKYKAARKIHPKINPQGFYRHYSIVDPSHLQTYDFVYAKPKQPYFYQKPASLPFLKSPQMGMDKTPVNMKGVPVNIPQLNYDYKTEWETKVWDTPAHRVEWKEPVKKISNVYYQQGGELEQYQLAGQYPRPTTQDSINLMNSSKAYLDYYKRKGYYTPAKQALNENIFDVLDQAHHGFGATPEVTFPINQKGDVKKGKLPMEYYRQDINENQFKQREPFFNILDTRSPMPLYDRRIEPQIVRTLAHPSRNPNTGTRSFANSFRKFGLMDPTLEQDMALMVAYDPIAVKPVTMKTDADWDYMEKTYGTPKPKPNLKPTPPAINHSVTPMKRLPMLGKHSKIKMKGVPMNMPRESVTIDMNDEIDYQTPRFAIYDQQGNIVNQGDLQQQYKQGGQPCYECGGQYEKGGHVFPAMRTMFKSGGYYGMDGRFHKNTDSGTYVAAGGYYFDPGGSVTDNMPPGINPQSAMELPSEFQSDFAYSNPTPETPTFDIEDYKTSIDPNTGFRIYTKKGTDTPYTNIKKQDEALWENLKQKGHGARWETGQTDFQRFAKQAQKVGQISQGVIDSAGILGNFISNQQGRRNMTNAAINMGSTDAMFTNPQSASKGDYGVTGSMYGTLKPYKSSNMSFKGMYGEYGMEVPHYQGGGGFSNLLATSASTMPVYNPMMSLPTIASSDNTRVATPRVRPENLQGSSIDVDLALQAVAGIESGAKAGETKEGMRTKLVGAGGKRATASGTYQITEQTLQEIYKKDDALKSKFESFDQFKSAFDKDPNVEYEAAKSLMSDHIKNYGVYALGAWYQPAFAKRAMKGDKSVYDIVPRKDYGNKKTWGQDFQEKLNAYNKLAGTKYNVSSAISTKSPSVNIKNLHPDLMQFTSAMSQNFPGIVLSSGNDSVHMKGSKHYKNKAIDIGANSSDKKSYMALKKFLMSNPSVKKQYGIEDIIDEGDHLHIELMKAGGQLGGQVVEMDDNEIQQFLAAGGQLEFID